MEEDEADKGAIAEPAAAPIPAELPEGDMEDDLPKRRLHGFEMPFHPLQVLSWFVFGIDIVIYMVFGLPLVGHSGARVSIALCYALSIVILVLATFRATACDPVDPNVIAPVHSAGEDADQMQFCAICNAWVFEKSKHCHACHKCVDVFDHHCMWLNNCVGGQNYGAFFVSVSSVAVMIGIILGTCLYLLVDIFTNVDPFQQRVLEIAFMEEFPREFFMAILITLVVVNLPLFLLDVQLVILHIFLWSQGLTTYDYIMSKRSQMEEEEAAKEPAEKAGSGDDREHRWSKKIRTLPSWMDWIVFSRCGRKRRKAKTPVEKIKTPEETDQEGEKDEQAEQAARPV